MVSGGRHWKGQYANHDGQGAQPEAGYRQEQIHEEARHIVGQGVAAHRADHTDRHADDDCHRHREKCDLQCKWQPARQQLADRIIPPERCAEVETDDAPHPAAVLHRQRVVEPQRLAGQVEFLLGE